jgi:hypothetical protein
VLDISTAQVATSKSFHWKAEKVTGDAGRQKFIIALRLSDRNISAEYRSKYMPRTN